MGTEQMLRLCVNVLPDGDRWFVDIPELPGCCVGGDTIPEALENAGAAMSVYIRSMLIHGSPLPWSPLIVIGEGA